MPIASGEPARVYRSVAEMIPDAVLSRGDIEALRREWPLIPDLPRWRRDPDVGFVERDYAMPYPGWDATGLGGSRATATIEDAGMRRMTRYDGVAPRINSYGDSYTHGDQVNDGETWQEYLAAHFREPIRNFGLGGGSVYQSYLRMVREETGPNAGSHILFYLWGDDHVRSLVGRAFPILGFAGRQVLRRQAFASPTLSFDLESRAFVEHPTLLPDPGALDRLGDVDWLRETLSGDLAAQLVLSGGRAARPDGGRRIEVVDDERMSALADALAVPNAWLPGRDRQLAARDLLDAYAFAATVHVVDATLRFAAEHGRRVLFLLYDPFRALPQLLAGAPRYDQPIVDALRDRGADVFDMTRVHLDELRTRNESWDVHRRRYFQDNHFNPLGSHFFAFALRPRLVEWLDPSPPSYRL